MTRERAHRKDSSTELVGTGHNVISANLPINAFTPVILVLVTAVLLGPFLGKAFHIDDPLFVWTAKQIQSHPTDPYGFTVNWYGTDMKMWEVMWNPPLTPYFIALVARLVGWSEPGLHFAFFLPAVAVVIGTYLLARRLCNRSVTAAFLTLMAPGFLVSSTTVMCDVMMLAFWVWATLLWLKGIEVFSCRRNAGARGFGILLLSSAILASACVMTKFNGLALVPLLLAYTVYRFRKPVTLLAYLAIPVFVLLAYRWAGARLYGPGFISHAIQTAVGGEESFGTQKLARLIAGLSFTGGLGLPVLFFSPLIFSRRVILALIGLTVGVIFFSPFLGSIGTLTLRAKDFGIDWTAAVQLSIFIIAGLIVLIIPTVDFLERRDSGALLLSLWVFGTFIFATFIAWSVSARYVLPMIPAVSIATMRMVDRHAGKKAGASRLALPLVPAVVVTMLVAWSDYSLANTARDAASQILRKHAIASRTVWYHGHWGFQYYMGKSDLVKPADAVKSKLCKGDLMVIPANNSKTYILPRRFLKRVDLIRLKAFPWVSVMDHRVGAGFYSDRWGPLPYRFGRTRPEEYEIAEVSRGLSAPFGSIPNLQMGIALNSSGKTKEAIKYLLNALEYDPKNAQAMFQLGLIAEELGNTKEAISWYRRAVRFDSNLTDAYLNLGAALRGEGKLEEAIQAYEAAIRVKPDFGAVHNNLAVALFLKGDLEGAWREVALARQYGVEPDPSFIRALQEMSR